jgi:hypothetical protein
MELYFEALKPHAIKDHLCYQLIKFHGIGDLTEDILEQAHQDGTFEDRLTSTTEGKAVVEVIHSIENISRNYR